MSARWWWILCLAALAVSCRLVAGYEDLSLTETGGGGSAGHGAGDTGGGNVTIVSLTATPDRVVGAREVELEWQVDNATSCEFDEGLGQAEPFFGTKSVTPSTTTTYTLTCQGPGGPASEGVLVTVLGVTMAGGTDFTCARMQGNTLKCFGLNDVGQLGQGDTASRGDAVDQMADALLDIDTGAGHYEASIGVGAAHVCAVLDDNSVKCWGANDRGQLGLGDVDHRGDDAGEMGDALAAVVLSGTDALALGGKHSCARLLNGSVKCWGANDQGQLGVGDPVDRGDDDGEMQSLPSVELGSGQTALAVAAGRAHSCALLEGGSVKCWGANEFGQLGQGHQNALGDAAGELGDALEPIDLGAGQAAVAIAAGSDHTCALLEDATVRCWGLNDHGQLGTGDSINHGDAPGTMGTDLLGVELGTGLTARAIAVGGSHVCALLSNDRVRCWGQNDRGQLGAGDMTDRGTTVESMGNALVSVELGTGRTAKSVAAGSRHTCAVLDDGTVRCWGFNGSGQLGFGDTHDRGDEAGELGDNILPVDITP